MAQIIATEWCSVCDTEDTIDTKRSNLGGIYFCHHCNNAMPLCSLCDWDKVNCSICSLAIVCEKLNKDINND